MPQRPTPPRAKHRPRFNRASGGGQRHVPTKHIPAALIVEAKRLYLHTTVPVADISALLGVGPDTFYRRMKKWGWPMRSKRIPRDEPAECAAVGMESAPGSASGSVPGYILPDEAEREALAGRVLRLIEQQVAATERASASLEGATPSDRAEDARALAALMRAVQGMSRTTKAKQENADEPDPAFRSLEELGRAISAHLETMESGAADSVPGAAEGG